MCFSLYLEQIEYKLLECYSWHDYPELESPSFFSDPLPNEQPPEHSPSITSTATSVTTGTPPTSSSTSADSRNTTIVLSLGGLAAILTLLLLLVFCQIRFNPRVKQPISAWITQHIAPCKQPNYKGRPIHSSTNSDAPAPCHSSPGQRNSELLEFPSRRVYISYSRYTDTSAAHARRMCRLLQQCHVDAVLDLDHEIDLADNWMSWLENELRHADHTVVLLDQYHPLSMHLSRDNQRALMEVSHGMCRSFSEADCLTGEMFSHRPDFIIPVIVGSGIASARSIVPMQMMASHIYRLPVDFSAVNPDFEQLRHRLLGINRAPCQDES
eukprot:scpid81225/ scgid1356/ 